MAKTQKSISKNVEKKPKLDNPIKRKKHQMKEEKPLQTAQEECKDNPIKRKKHQIKEEKHLQTAQEECKEELEKPIKNKKNVKKEGKPLQTTQDQNNSVEAVDKPMKKKVRGKKKEPHSHENMNKGKINGQFPQQLREHSRAINYNKDTFEKIINVPSIRTQVKSLKVQIQKHQSENDSPNQLQYLLRVNNMNPVNCFRKVVTINLKHALLSKGGKVLLIVSDLRRGIEYKKTKQHYEDLFKAQGIENITVLPMDKLYKKYKTLDQKSRIFQRYDYFLCDERMIVRVIKYLAKSCKKTHSIFQSVYMNNPYNLKKQIQISIKKTTFNQKPAATKYCIHVGNTSFSATSLAQNIVYVVHQLKKVFPGGILNIRNILLTTNLREAPVAILYSRMSETPESGDSDEVVELKTKYMKAIAMLHQIKSEICEYVGTVHQKKIAELNEEVKNHGLPETDDDEDDAKSSPVDDEIAVDSSDDDDNNEMVQEEDEAESESEIAGNGMKDEDEETEESD